MPSPATNARRRLPRPWRRQWELVKIVCFTLPDMDGNYLSEADYSFLFGIAPNIQHALESADEVIRASIGSRYGRS